MIRIARPLAIPAKLTNEGTAEEKRNCSAYDKASADYVSGKAKFFFPNSIYGHSSVKSVLKKAQHDKCCFCEKDQVEEFGAVEHFRPKKAYKTSRKSRLKKPGYYWLAYRWENLFFVCGFCNSSKYKGNLFPLVDETKRAKSHHDDENQEDAYLIDPAKINPRDHIYFKGPLVYGKTPYGIETISICGLDRESLNSKRRELIDNLDVRILTLALKGQVDPAVFEKAQEYIRKSMDPSSPLSATAIDYLSQFNFQKS